MSHRSDWADLGTVSSAFIGLFKTCYKFTWRLATDMVGFSTGLVNNKGTDDGRVRNKWWTRTFVWSIERLVCQTFVRGVVVGSHLSRG